METLSLPPPLLPRNTPVARRKARSPWKKTSVPGLRIYTPTGQYYAYFKANGKPIKKSLETTVRSIAEQRLRDQKALHRGSVKQAASKKILTFGDGLADYRHLVDTAVNNKDSSKDYREQTIVALLRSWPSLPEADMRKITEHDCREWAKSFALAYSAGRYNNTVGTLRGVLQIGIDRGYFHRNPGFAVKKMRIVDKPLTLPPSDKFQEFVREVRSGGGRFSDDAADLTEFLGYSGARKEEAARSTWGHVNFRKNELTIAGDAVTGTKNWDYRTIPMVAPLRNLLLRMRAKLLEPPKADEPICRVRECQKSMDRAAEKVEIGRLTHHNLRDLFATECIEAGVPVPTVALWLGHKDGGALCMKKYVNPRIGAGHEAAGRVTFGQEK
ncbi:MAG: tyrosine-type recombinase/integrase [Verrucomicrobiota bacterium]|nr:tyrosine-type recombinase/integrase [Verrucomicrobiota bacterium]